MRHYLIVLILFFVPGEGMADTSREDKIAFIIETQDFRGQIIAYEEEVMKRAIAELNEYPQVNLSDEQKSIIMQENSKAMGEVIDNYIVEIIDVYLEHLNDRELDAIYNFYRSPEGKSLGDKLPAIKRKVFWIDVRYLELLTKRAVSRMKEKLSR
jgi:hypothetical protein